MAERLTRVPRVREVESSNPKGRSNLIQRCKRLCCLGAMTRRWAPQTRYTLRRNTTSIMKGLAWFEFKISRNSLVTQRLFAHT